VWYAHRLPIRLSTLSPSTFLETLRSWRSMPTHFLQGKLRFWKGPVQTCCRFDPFDKHYRASKGTSLSLGHQRLPSWSCRSEDAPHHPRFFNNISRNSYPGYCLAFQQTSFRPGNYLLIQLRLSFIKLLCKIHYFILPNKKNKRKIIASFFSS